MPAPGPGQWERPHGAVRAAWTILGSVVAVALLVWAVFEGMDVVARDEVTVLDRYPSSAVAAVDLEIDRGDVRVVATEGDTVTVRGRLGRGLLAGEHDRGIEDDLLRVRSRCRGWAYDSCYSHYEIEAPEGVAVTVHGSHGDIDIEGIAGGVDAGSTTGNIRVFDVSGTLRLESRHGDVEATEVTATSTELRTSTGSIRLVLSVQPETVVARSSHGNVEVVVPAGETSYRLDASSDHGSVSDEVRTDPLAERTITAATSTGDVTVRYP